MVLEIQFSPGYSQFVDLGNDFLLIKPENEEEFEKRAKAEHHNAPDMTADTLAFVDHKDGVIPLYKDFKYWIYSADQPPIKWPAIEMAGLT